MNVYVFSTSFSVHTITNPSPLPKYATTDAQEYGKETFQISCNEPSIHGSHSGVAFYTNSVKQL